MRVLLVLGVAVAALVCGNACGKKADPSAQTGAAKDTIAITVDGEGFKPSTVKLRKGAPATMIFTRTTDETCATDVEFPLLAIKKELPKDKPVAITIPTDKEQTLTFQCGMGMYKSSVVITAN